MTQKLTTIGHHTAFNNEQSPYRIVGMQKTEFPAKSLLRNIIFYSLKIYISKGIYSDIHLRLPYLCMSVCQGSSDL